MTGLKPALDRQGGVIEETEQMARAKRKLAELTVEPDGDDLIFIVRDDRGETTELACRFEDFETIVENLLHAAIAVSARRSTEQIRAAVPTGEVHVRPIPALSVAIGGGIVPTQPHLCLHLGILNLTFAVQASQLKSIVEKIGRFRPVPRRSVH